MWPRERLLLEWRQRAPRWTAAAIAALLAVDLGHSAWLLRPTASGEYASGTDVSVPPRAGGGSPNLPRRPDTQQIIGSHLFGAVAGRPGTGDASSAPDTRLQLALSGIIAGKNPKDGLAMIGPQGQPTRLYCVGDPIAAAGGARLYRVFADRVVLESDGGLETLRLPRHSLPGLAPSRSTEDVATAADAASPAPAPAPAPADDPNHPTPAQGLFGYMAVEQNNIDGRMVGVVLHPAKLIQRQYGLHDGDTVTAVNGIQITDPGVLEDTLKTSGKSLSLTLTHDGVQQTKTVQLND
jgi:general secretion pathway protein C